MVQVHEVQVHEVQVHEWGKARVTHEHGHDRFPAVIPHRSAPSNPRPVENPVGNTSAHVMIVIGNTMEVLIPSW
jgi:hypothetical protein